MTRCRYSELGKRRLNPIPRTRDREGEFLGWNPSKYSPESVLVRWDGTKSVQGYHHSFIEIIIDPDYPNPGWSEWL